MIVLAWLLLIPFCSAVDRLSLPWIRRLLSTRDAPRHPPSARGDPATVEHLARLVAVAGRLRRRPAGCLERSLVLALLLKALRIPAHLRIGVRLTEDGLRAHAWLEGPFGVVGGGPETGFVPLSPSGSQR